mmetsp:Transcript_24319/g.39437  ORF Transcript_24319/g.39437 Transcript_24319/m.39437 type:complete len:687 (-) Transcript_24319:56-2116(-)|eukprot:CAMPEP_0203759218 /NCGR_PEP_ID=MMETSP0098-20131031/12187_1 /ASSEMBLY_ACC=CAM_ASM_000208 /TAXON_ID=96639 /ORGANISM=" , Strain NY0313808BC1" /LENGTH=686 /DNA_ID=CAMNT_0050652033 /DNA_START=325 /DNA_END=2385 /DNA_ORIENTATION=-
MRLFLGGFRGDASEDEVRRLIDRVKSVEHVEDLQVRQGGDIFLQDWYAFVDVLPDQAAEECIKLYNKCRWKKNVLRVQKIKKGEFSVDNTYLRAKAELKEIDKTKAAEKAIAESRVYDPAIPLRIRRKRGRRGMVIVKPNNQTTFDEDGNPILVEKTQEVNGTKTESKQDEPGSDSEMSDVSSVDLSSDDESSVGDSDVSSVDLSSDHDSSSSDEEEEEAENMEGDNPKSIQLATEKQLESEKQRGLSVLSQLLGETVKFDDGEHEDPHLALDSSSENEDPETVISTKQSNSSDSDVDSTKTGPIPAVRECSSTVKSTLDAEPDSSEDEDDDTKSIGSGKHNGKSTAKAESSEDSDREESSAGNVDVKNNGKPIAEAESSEDSDREESSTENGDIKSNAKSIPEAESSEDDDSSHEATPKKNNSDKITKQRIESSESDAGVKSTSKNGDGFKQRATSVSSDSSEDSCDETAMVDIGIVSSKSRQSALESDSNEGSVEMDTGKEDTQRKTSTTNETKGVDMVVEAVDEDVKSAPKTGLKNIFDTARAANESHSFSFFGSSASQEETARDETTSTPEGEKTALRKIFESTYSKETPMSFSFLGGGDSKPVDETETTTKVDFTKTQEHPLPGIFEKVESTLKRKWPTPACEKFVRRENMEEEWLDTRSVLTKDFRNKIKQAKRKGLGVV